MGIIIIIVIGLILNSKPFFMTYYAQSLAIKKKVYGDEHTTVASSLNNIGVVLRDLGSTKRLCHIMSDL